LSAQNITGFCNQLQNARFLALHDLNAKDGDDQTILHHACGWLLLRDDVSPQSRYSAVSSLLETNSIDHNITGCNDHRTPLLHAVLSGNIDATHRLMRCTPILWRASQSRSPRGGIVHAMVLSKGSPLVFETLMEEYRVLQSHLGDADNKGRNALHHSALYPCNIKLTYLIRTGFNFFQLDFFGQSFLHLLCCHADTNKQFNCWSTVFEMCTPEHINQRDHAGRSVMHYVHDADIAAELHRLGGDINSQDYRNLTPQYNVCPEVRHLFLSLGAEQTANGPNVLIGHTPLWFIFERYKACNQPWDNVNDMLKHPNTNHQLRHSQHGLSTLHIVVLGEYWLEPESYQLLLDHPRQADPHAVSDHGICLLAYISNHGTFSHLNRFDDLKLLDILFLITKSCVSSTGDVRN
jgi:hypothetical protein